MLAAAILRKTSTPPNTSTPRTTQSSNHFNQGKIGAGATYEHLDSGIRLGDSTVMLSLAKHLAAHRDRPFAALRVTVEVPLYRAHRRLIGPGWVCLPSR